MVNNAALTRPLAVQQLLHDCLLFDYAALTALVPQLGDAAARRGPVCLDQLLPEELLTLLERELAAMPEAGGAPGAVLTMLVQELQCGSFIAFLEIVSGLRALLPDPYLAGAGVLQIAPGSAVPLHGPEDRHPLMQLDPQLVLEVCLDPRWEPRWGGGLAAVEIDGTGPGHAPGRALVCALSGTSCRARAVDAVAPRALRVLRLYYYGGLRDST